MKRIIDVDMEVNTKKVATALNKFFRKYPELDYWKEQLEYMAENGEQFNSDKNDMGNEWRWALHLINEENFVYIAIIERA